MVFPSVITPSSGKNSFELTLFGLAARGDLSTQRNSDGTSLRSSALLEWGVTDDGLWNINRAEWRRRGYDLFDVVGAVAFFGVALAMAAIDFCSDD